ncbi:MAG: hypothetical protein FJ128_01475 [Deltaproteobacteria bacterium]|nr:hypothetical protein [Deltaproteobacteria bacterium]
MLPEINKLIELQEMDREILELTQDLEQVPRELEALARELEEMAAALAQHEQSLEDLQRQRRETEGEMVALESAIKASRIRLMDIKKDLEYRAMLKEIAFQEDQRDQKETRILEILEEIERRNQEIMALREQLAERQTNFEHQQGEGRVRLAALQERLTKAEEQRQVIRAGVPPMLLKRYEFIRQRHNSTTLAEVQHSVCLGCHMNILPQQYIDLQKGEEIIQCPNCQRLLYWVGEADEEEAAEPKPGRRAAKS